MTCYSLLGSTCGLNRTRKDDCTTSKYRGILKKQIGLAESNLGDQRENAGSLQVPVATGRGAKRKCHDNKGKREKKIIIKVAHLLARNGNKARTCKSFPYEKQKRTHEKK